MTDARATPDPLDPDPPVSDIPAAEHKRRARIARFGQPLITPGDRLRAWIDMLFSDHGIIRLAYLNMHRVADGVWRAGQPAPGQLRRFARRGGRSVVSLRAGRGFGSLPLELEACRDAGLTFHSQPIRSHALPSREELRAAAHLFATMERPALLHCKSGADRSGFAAALYLMLAEGRPVAQARRQLSLRYGHNRFGRAGLLDAFFDAYACETGETPMPLMEWVETVYDPDRIAAGFTRTSPGALIANRLLRRVPRHHQDP
jgi:protein tyrosine phosphatase (PTP) superfamily phosphohydrolase (DUF442 family)